MDCTVCPVVNKCHALSACNQLRFCEAYQNPQLYDWSDGYAAGVASQNTDDWAIARGQAERAAYETGYRAGVASVDVSCYYSLAEVGELKETAYNQGRETGNAVGFEHGFDAGVASVDEVGANAEGWHDGYRAAESHARMTAKLKRLYAHVCTRRHSTPIVRVRNDSRCYYSDPPTYSGPYATVSDACYQ
jgi:hypothetical protein